MEPWAFCSWTVEMWRWLWWRMKRATSHLLDCLCNFSFGIYASHYSAVCSPLVSICIFLHMFGYYWILVVYAFGFDFFIGWALLTPCAFAGFDVLRSFSCRDLYVSYSRNFELKLLSIDLWVVVTLYVGTVPMVPACAMCASLSTCYAHTQVNILSFFFVNCKYLDIILTVQK